MTDTAQKEEAQQRIEEYTEIMNSLIAEKEPGFSGTRMDYYDIQVMLDSVVRPKNGWYSCHYGDVSWDELRDIAIDFLSRVIDGYKKQLEESSAGTQAEQGQSGSGGSGQEGSGSEQGSGAGQGQQATQTAGSSSSKTGTGVSAASTGPTTTMEAEFNAESNRSSTRITDQMLTNALGPLEVAGMLGNKDEVKARQHMLNWDDYHTEYKKPNLNKFPNNEDPFPVDLKIEEFEAHWPNVKIYEITCDKKAESVAVGAMRAADAAEKRIIKLENNMATMMRLLFRLGCRVPINCVYYGGQNPNFEKYKGIRCMCDDRITDGQQVQIDQCLYCTRFEPIFGQVYELLNDTGMNVAAILDDNQMSYRDMKDFVANARYEKYMKEHEKTNVPATQNEVETRSQNEFSFKDRWGAGIAMDWTYVPKEQQKCHINWRQSINDDGSKIGRLGSWPYMYDRPNIKKQKTVSGSQNKENKDKLTKEQESAKLHQDYDKFAGDFNKYKDERYEQWKKDNNITGNDEKANREAYEKAQEEHPEQFESGMYVGSDSSEREKAGEYASKKHDYENKLADISKREEEDQKQEEKTKKEEELMNGMPPASDNGGSDGKAVSARNNISSMGTYTNIEPEQKAAVDTAIGAGKTAGEEAKGDDVKNRVACDWQNDIIDALQGKPHADVLTIASLMFCSGSENAEDVVKKYFQTVKAVGTDNPAVVIPAYMLGKEVIVGGNGMKPIWEVPLYLPEEDDEDDSEHGTSSSHSDSGSGHGNSGSGSGGARVRPQAPPLEKNEINSWLYGDALYVERLAKQAKAIGGDIDMYPKVVNTYNELVPLLRLSPYDEDDNTFPFTADTLQNNEIYYSAAYGLQNFNGVDKLHRGVDFACQEGVEFVAAHDGTVTYAGGDDNMICIDHGNGWYSRYLHGQILCGVGQRVAKGQVIGKVGKFGHCAGAHLHFEFCDGDSVSKLSDKDPLAKYPKFFIPINTRIPYRAFVQS